MFFLHLFAPSKVIVWVPRSFIYFILFFPFCTNFSFLSFHFFSCCWCILSTSYSRIPMHLRTSFLFYLIFLNILEASFFLLCYYIDSGALALVVLYRFGVASPFLIVFISYFYIVGCFYLVYVTLEERNLQALAK